MSEETKSYIEDEILKARCPHCGDVNAFPEFTQVDAFICHGCNEPVKVLAVAAVMGKAAAEHRVAALCEERDALRTALQEIAEANARWISGCGSYGGGETHAGFAARLQAIARASLAKERTK